LRGMALVASATVHYRLLTVRSRKVVTEARALGSNPDPLTVT